MPRENKSWGQTIRLMTEDEQARYRRLGWDCTGKCEQPAVYETAYNYITGRSGRVGSARRNACTQHGKKFAERHNLELPTTPTTREKTAMEQALTQLGIGGAS